MRYIPWFEKKIAINIFIPVYKDCFVISRLLSGDFHT